VTKKECFFVWRGWSGLKLQVGISRNSRLSRLALEVAIEDLDVFQNPDATCRVLPPYRVQVAS